MPEPVITYFRIRVVATFNAGNKEITNDLPTLHQAHYEVVAFQPGNPGSSALGSFTIKLHPPGSEGYAAAKPIYDALDYFQRVELYGSADGASLGKLYYAGIITAIRKSYGPTSVFELTGHSDIVLANLSKPFPSESISNALLDCVSQAESYFGTNELGAADTFNPFTAGNYTSSNLPALTAGTWSSTTDDGLNVVSCATGTAAALIAKTGAVRQDGALQTHFAEISGRLNPSADATNAGKFGIGLTKSNANCADCVVAYVTARKSGSNWNLDVTATTYAASAIAATQTVTSALTVVQDTENLLPLTISVFTTTGQNAQVVVNGHPVFGFNPGWATGGLGTGTIFPFLFYGIPATGTATAFETNLVQAVRCAWDPAFQTASVFIPGSVDSTTQGLSTMIDAGPTFLEVWARAMTRVNFYMRYTPQPYVIGSRILGKVDLKAEPGTDRGTNKSVVFSRTDGTLVDLQLTANADSFVSGSQVAGPPSSSTGGLAYWRDIGTMQKYGMIEDQLLIATATDFTEQRRFGRQATSNRVNISALGSKTVTVLRDPQTADVWRELDRIMIHDPEMGLNYMIARVVGYTFDEGQSTQTLTLDQFSTDDLNLLSKRMQTSLWQVAGKFNTR
jgi:hypothetical protein